MDLSFTLFQVFFSNQKVTTNIFIPTLAVLRHLIWSGDPLVEGQEGEVHVGLHQPEVGVHVLAHPDIHLEPGQRDRDIILEPGHSSGTWTER